MATAACMSRIRYLVSYDISHPKRLRRVARVLEGFGVRLQYSVFECPLDEMRLAMLKAALQPILKHDEDQVLFVSLGPSSNDASLIIEALGLPYTVRTRVTII
ncbi:MAG TPA: CRISPR-associated endonuclease Cas2 [Methylomirabilota bacterium]|nr:CRISPR-associated endonuclease Cas2 [Methylomirabilota bacterium]